MSNMTHRVSREEDGVELTCEAFNRATRFSKTTTAKLTVFCQSAALAMLLNFSVPRKKRIKIR